MSEPTAAAWPPGAAYIERAGWEDDPDHGRRFVARLVFPAGTPDWPVAVVWGRLPMRVQHLNAHDELVAALTALHAEADGGIISGATLNAAATALAKVRGEG